MHPLSAGAKHDFRRVTLGVRPRGPAKSLVFFSEKSVLLRVFCRGVGKDRRHIHTVLPNLSVPRRLGSPHGACVLRSKKFCPLRVPHWGTPEDTHRTARAVLTRAVSRQENLHKVWSNPVMFIRARQRSREGVMQENPSSKVWFGQSILFSTLCSLDSRGTWVKSKHFKITVSSWSVAVSLMVGWVSWGQLFVSIDFKRRAVASSQPPVLCSLAAFLESTACTKPDGSSAWLLIQVIVHSPYQKLPIKCRDTYAQGKDGNTNKNSA